MKEESKMIALNNTSTIQQSQFNEQAKKGLVSERAAIVICGLGVAIFAVPILVVIQVMSGLFWGGATVYKLLNGSGFEAMDEV
jgi:hypothetical protein